MKAKNNGRTVKIYNEKGEKIYDENFFVQRDKISDDSKQELVNAIEALDGDQFRRIILEILTGQTVEEIKQQ